MSMILKKIIDLSVNDFDKFPVWAYTNEHDDETAMAPVTNLPVDSLDSSVVGTQVIFSNGDFVWAMLGNVDNMNARLTELFLTATFFRGTDRFHLFRYFDHDYEGHGANALADFYGLLVGQVFPIRYDIRHLAIGAEEALVGEILSAPREMLTRSQILELSAGG